MRLRKEKAIVTIYDAVSILKGFNVVNGSLTQNYYAESATYVPNRYIIPLVLRPKIDVSDPNNVIENGDKVDELARLEWFENGVKINSNDDFKIEGANLTIFKNSEEPFEISYRAEWFDSRKKQSITIEDTILVSCMSLAQSEFNARLSLDKPQNWLHNPLKNERIYKIRAYVSKDKVYDGAVAWYYVDSNKKDKLIDETCNFYVGGQNTNELSIDSAYMDNVIIKAKNISNDKLKEVYWFFDKEGNPITYSEPDKTIIEGKDIFNLPESPITSKLDYRIEGLSLINKATEVIKGGGDFSKDNIYWRQYEDAVKSFSINKNGITVESKDGENSVTVGYYDNIYFDNYYTILRVHSNSNIDKTIFAYSGTSVNVSPIHRGGYTYYINKYSISSGSVARPLYEFYNSEGKSLKVTLNYMMLIPAYLLEGYSKERIVDNIQGYFEGTKSVTAPLRIKSVTNNILLGSDRDSSSFENPYQSIYKPSKFLEKGKTYTIAIDVTEEVTNSAKGYTLYTQRIRGSSTNQLGVVSLNNRIDDVYYGTFVAEEDYLSKVTEWNLWYRGEGNKKTDFTLNKVMLCEGNYSRWNDYRESNLYINNSIELKSVGTVKDYIENGKLYKNIGVLSDITVGSSISLGSENYEAWLIRKPLDFTFGQPIQIGSYQSTKTIIRNATDEDLYKVYTHLPHYGRLDFGFVTKKGEFKTSVEVYNKFFKGVKMYYKQDETEIINLNTSGLITNHPNGTIFIDNAIQLEEQYQEGVTIKEDYPIQVLESIKVGKEYLDISKAVVKDNLITHPDIENGDNVTIEYIYDENPIRNTNSIAYLVLEDILDEFWLDNVYTYKITNGEWELVKVTDIEDYEEWLKTEKTSPYTLAPDGVIFDTYEAETKFIRQYPSSLYVDIIAPTRLKQGITKIKARVLVGTRDGVVENPSNYFHFVWYRKENQAGAVETIIGHGEEIEIDIKEKDMIGVELQSLGVLSDTKTGDDRTLTDDENRKITLR